MPDSVPTSDEFWEGVKYGIWLYAWWKDGVQYVGSTGTTFRQAMKAVEETRGAQILAANKGTYRIDPDT